MDNKIKHDLGKRFRNFPDLKSGNSGGFKNFLYLMPGRSGDRIPVGAMFSAPVQTDPGAHPASYKMGTGSFSLG
jgi:hypothetical protein